jgi:hypothetical protein
MRKTAGFFLVSCLLGVLWVSCNREEINLSAPTYELEEFFPLGKFEWVYRADSVIYDRVGTEQIVDSSSSYLRYQMEQRGTDWFQIISQRPDSSSDWSLAGTVKISLHDGRVRVNQNGITIDQLIYPIRIGGQWEESALVSPNFSIIVAGESVAPFSIPWDARYEDFIDSFSPGDAVYSRVIKKRSIDQDVFIERRLRTEWYAQDYGLIFAQGFFADTQCEHIEGELGDCIDIPWPEKATKGYQYSLTLESFGPW